MSFNFNKPIWTVIEEREREIQERLDVLDVVEEVLQEMWISCKLIIDFNKNKKFNNSSELLINTYYFRNYQYLFSSYELGKKGFTMPSHNLQRTVLESIIKGYIFILNKDISDKFFITTSADINDNDPYYKNMLKTIIEKNNLDEFFIISAKKILSNNIGEDDKKELMRKINNYNKFEYNIKKMYKSETHDHWNGVYKQICRTAHPSVWGVITDLRFDIDIIKNNMEFILFLCFMNMFMFLEMFFEDIKSKELINLFKTQLSKIDNTIKPIPYFVPNNYEYMKKIKFKEDNYKILL